MTDREKLVDLLRKEFPVMVGSLTVGAYKMPVDQAKVLADHLIANGVTFVTDNNIGHTEEIDFDYAAED